MEGVERTSEILDERTALWWKCLRLPFNTEDRMKLREGYTEKVKAHSADKLDDPLSESVFEVACKDVVRDLNAGFYFPQRNEISIAAKNGKLDGAEMAVGLWLLENNTEPNRREYQPAIGVLAAVIYYQLSQSNMSNDGSSKADEDIEADCFILLNALLNHMSCFMFETSNTSSPHSESDGLFDDDAIGPFDSMLHAISSKLVSVDPVLFDCLEANSPISGSAPTTTPATSTLPSSSPSTSPVPTTPFDDEGLKAVGGNSLDRSQSASLNNGGNGGDDEVNETYNYHGGNELWSKSWLVNLMSRQCDGNPNHNLLRIWDEIFIYIAGYNGINLEGDDNDVSVSDNLMTTDAWVNCLGPIMIAMLIDSRELILSKSISLSPSVIIAGKEGAKWSRILENSKLIRTPERISLLDPKCKVATFQIGPLGLVLGPTDDGPGKSALSSTSSGEGKSLRVRKFQRTPANPADGTGGGPMQAELSGMIELGDILVAVNGINVRQGLTAAEVVDLLKRVGRPVKVAFKKPPQPPPAPPQAQRPQQSPPQMRANIQNPTSSSNEESYSDLVMSATSSLIDGIDPEVMQGVSQAAKGLGNFAMAAAASAGVPAGQNWGQNRDSGTPPPIIDEPDDPALAQHASILVADDDFKLPTIAGEVYEAVLSAQMHAFQRTRLCDGALEKVYVTGQLFVSNYRIYFHSMDKVNTQHRDWSIPVHTVEKFESLKVEGGGNKNSMQQQSLNMSTHLSSDKIGRTLGLYCKDGQVRRFSTHRSLGEDQLLADEFHYFQRKFYQWSYGREDAFAKVHTLALIQEGIPPVPEAHSLQDMSLIGDFERLGLGSYTKLRLVKQHELNLCLTYPLELLVPAIISNKDLMASAKYRSKQRLPVVTWFDIRTGASIARSSQPLVGMNSKRCPEDEKLLREYAALTFREGMDGPLPCTYFIVDARSKVATRGNQLMGKGVEQIKYYRDNRYSTDLRFMNIGNIHACRESFEQLAQLCQPGALEGSTSSQGWYGKLDNTGWLSHIQAILRASNFIVETVTRDKCSVLVHCSDGWDRTPQLCATAQLLIDAHYRTLKGFAFLVEKEWVVFGHKFSDRCAHSSQQVSEEKSAVFTLWIDCIWQIMRQYPTIFEFNEDLLIALLDHLNSCRFSSFLYNSFIERNKNTNDTTSIWTWVEQRYESFLNPNYEKYTEGPVLPSVNPLNMILWERLFQRFDLTKLPINPDKQNEKTFYD